MPLTLPRTTPDRVGWRRWCTAEVSGFLALADLGDQSRAPVRRRKARRRCCPRGQYADTNGRAPVGAPAARRLAVGQHEFRVPSLRRVRCARPARAIANLHARQILLQRPICDVAIDNRPIWVCAVRPPNGPILRTRQLDGDRPVGVRATHGNQWTQEDSDTGERTEAGSTVRAAARPAGAAVTGSEQTQRRSLPQVQLQTTSSRRRSRLASASRDRSTGPLRNTAP